MNVHVLLCCRYDQLLTLVHSVNGASLLVGGPGTAKTTVINQFLGKFNSEVRPTGFALKQATSSCALAPGTPFETTKAACYGQLELTSPFCVLLPLPCSWS